LFCAITLLDTEEIRRFRVIISPATTNPRLKSRPYIKKNKKAEEALEKLMKSTKLMKLENVKVAPKGPPKAANKWRGEKPTFTPKAPAPANLVDGGGMQVDPSLKEEYDAWRKDKLAEQEDRRAAMQRKAEAAKKKRADSSF
jgi:hypothetical protein